MAKVPDKKPVIDLTIICRPRHHDIRNYLCHDSGGNSHARDAKPPGRQPITPTDNISSHFVLPTEVSHHEPRGHNHGRRPTIIVNTLFSPTRPPLQPIPAPTITGDASNAATDSQYLLSFTRLSHRFQRARTQPDTVSTDTWRFFPWQQSQLPNGVSLTN
jgi:hypothetical protein